MFGVQTDKGIKIVKRAGSSYQTRGSVVQRPHIRFWFESRQHFSTEGAVSPHTDRKKNREKVSASNFGHKTKIK